MGQKAKSDDITWPFEGFAYFVSKPSLWPLPIIVF